MMKRVEQAGGDHRGAVLCFTLKAMGSHQRKVGRKEASSDLVYKKSFSRQGPKWRQTDQRGSSGSEWRWRSSMKEIRRMEKGTDPVLEIRIGHNTGTG